MGVDWEGMNQLYHSYNVESHSKGEQVTKNSLMLAKDHLIDWIKHVGPKQDGVIIAKGHINRLKNLIDQF